MPRPPKIAIIYYSVYGHIKLLAEAQAKGIKAASGQVDILQVPETLSEEVLVKMHAPPKESRYTILDSPETLEKYDGFLFGIPTRYGTWPAQWRSLWDQTGPLWVRGALSGKYAGLFISTASLGGGQESTAIAAMSTLAHHGMIHVPLGFKSVSHILSDISEVRGGSAWGAGTFTAPDGSRQPSAKEIELAEVHGKQFYETIARVNFA
ncbi:hypothetical protein CKM354_000792300 [Cercospora kikuchii]|uniref:Flavodoxin-like domain-containing protein n=1 Tax=Cercospora kikuchii TaxID=84275 RepID=A0A9P3FHW5_9PEZI|nr:uncharacterized protein CKM354_000792300 [Cercospora kikuchii]GIZ44732.1 hypothetical protein CKM354_000792300 [Cercospora kikuchii]